LNIALTAGRRNSFYWVGNRCKLQECRMVGTVFAFAVFSAMRDTQVGERFEEES
jgi:hypothetical protein